MNKLALSLLVGALLVPAVVCTVNAQTLVDVEFRAVPSEVKQKLESSWKEKNLELAKTMGKVKFTQDYQETMCTIYMALQKAGFEITSVTEPGIILARTDQLLTSEEKEELQKKYYAELEEAGYKVDDTKKTPGTINPTFAPVKMTICVFQTYIPSIRTQAVSENRYSTIEEKVANGTVVSMFLKSQTQSSNLYPAAAEESYIKLIEIFREEGLMMPVNSNDLSFSCNANYYKKKKEKMEKEKTAEQTVSEK